MSPFQSKPNFLNQEEKDFLLLQKSDKNAQKSIHKTSPVQVKKYGFNLDDTDLSMGTNLITEIIKKESATELNSPFDQEAKYAEIHASGLINSEN